jgi:hypothetical protein
MSFQSKQARARNRAQKTARKEEKVRLEAEELAQASKKKREEDAWQEHKDSQENLPPNARAVKAAIFSLDSNPLRPRAGTILERRLKDDEIRDYFAPKDPICKASFYKAKKDETERRRKVQTAQFFAEDKAQQPQSAGTAAGHAARVSFDDTAGPAGESEKDREDRLAQELKDAKAKTDECRKAVEAAQQALQDNTVQNRARQKLKQDLQDANTRLGAARVTQAHALDDLINGLAGVAPAESAAPRTGVQQGRPPMFTEETFEACKAEFRRLNTGIKNGISTDYLVKMLLEKRQEVQGRDTILPEPSLSALLDAVRRLDTETAPFSCQPDSRARALEDYLNAISCCAVWCGIDRMGICPALMFSIDEVGICLNSRDKKNTASVLHFQRGVLAESVRRGLSPSTVEPSKQLRMAYLSCMTTAEGHLAATVAIIKDKKCDKNKIIIQNINESLWTCFVHPDMKKEQVSRVLLKSIYIPVISTCQGRVAVQLSQSDDAAVVVPISDTPEMVYSNPVPNYRLQRGEIRPRAILTFDGANETIEAIMKSRIAEECLIANITLLKWAAACSMTQQPNDVSKCHAILHKLFKTYPYSKVPKHFPTEMMPAITIMKKLKMTAASRLVFQIFFCHLQDILSQAFTRAVVQRGWATAGIYDVATGGYNPEMIMRGWNAGGQNPQSSWLKLTEESRRFILGIMPQLADMYMTLGELDDSTMDNHPCFTKTNDSGVQVNVTVRDIMTNEGATAVPEYRKAQAPDALGQPGKGINLRRLILVTNDSWLKAAKLSRAALGSTSAFEANFKNCGCGSKAKTCSYVRVFLCVHVIR